MSGKVLDGKRRREEGESGDRGRKREKGRDRKGEQVEVKGEK